MKFFGMGVPELVIILAVVLLIFGPRNLPKLGASLGKTVKSLREGMGGSRVDAEESDEDEEAVVEMEESEPEEPVQYAAKKTVRKKAVRAAQSA